MVFAVGLRPVLRQERRRAIKARSGSMTTKTVRQQAVETGRETDLRDGS
jgi:hypothetical protein